MRHRGVETREKEKGKGREESCTMAGVRGEARKRGSGAPEAALSFPCPRTAQAPFLQLCTCWTGGHWMLVEALSPV